MNATVRSDYRSAEHVPVTIFHTRGGWPWKCRCEVCGVDSPSQRTRDEAQAWAESHYHAFHEVV